MRHLLLLLLLANILYFVWGWFGHRALEPGIAVIDEPASDKRLAISTGDAQGSFASVGAVLGSAAPAELALLSGKTCVTIGPFTSVADAEGTLERHTQEGMQTGLRSVPGRIFIGHWVQIRDIEDRSTANGMLERLQRAGFRDAYLVPNEDGSNNISLGLFAELERAETVQSQVRALSLPADITPRTREGELHYVDVGLPPSRGAAGMIDRYGQDRVLLREDARCPEKN